VQSAHADIPVAAATDVPRMHACKPSAVQLPQSRPQQLSARLLALLSATQLYCVMFVTVIGPGPAAWQVFPPQFRHFSLQQVSCRFPRPPDAAGRLAVQLHSVMSVVPPLVCVAQSGVPPPQIAHTAPQHPLPRLPASSCEALVLDMHA
jgi:hypothetical protein